jgi:cytoskeletal protein CcmA (bactofilin family)
MVFNLKRINSLLFISVLFSVTSAQAGFTPLLGSQLNNQSLYASGYITMGAGTTVGGNVQSTASVMVAAGAIVGGNIESGTTTTLGATAGVGGYIESTKTVTLGASSTVGGSIQAGTTATMAANSKIQGDLMAGTTVTIASLVEIDGDVLGGSTVTVGAGSIFGGNVDAGIAATIGAGVKINGELTSNSLQPVSPAPLVMNQEALITSVQTTLKELGKGTELVSTTFGTNDETLEAGIYSTINYLSIAMGKTLTLDGKGIDGSWVFNISNYLSFAANAKVILNNVTDNSRIIWNVLGEKTGSAGYTQLGAGAEARGHIFAKGFVQTGANALIAGVGNDCGGAFSATDFIEFGAKSVIGKEGCTNGAVAKVTPIPEPTSIWLLGLGIFGLTVITKRS